MALLQPLKSGQMIDADRGGVSFRSWMKYNREVADPAGGQPVSSLYLSRGDESEVS
jgi:hypothetical protein